MNNLLTAYDQFLESYFNKKQAASSIKAAYGKMVLLEEFLVLTADYECLAAKKADELLAEDQDSSVSEKERLRITMISMINEKLAVYMEKNYSDSIALTPSGKSSCI